MRRLLVPIIVLLTGCDTERVAKLQKEKQELTAKLLEANATQAEAKKAASLELQGKCAKQAKEQYAELGWNKQDNATYTSHYNSNINKCFMEVQNSSVQGDDIFMGKSVLDAFERKQYADYLWKAEKGKKYWEVPPAICSVTHLAGEQIFCQSTGEFDQLVKEFMQ